MGSLLKLTAVRGLYEKVTGTTGQLGWWSQDTALHDASQWDAHFAMQGFALLFMVQTSV